MKKITIYRALFLASIFILPGHAFTQFRVVGYVPVHAQSVPVLGDSILKKLTHLNIAFVNPDSSGSLFLPVGIDSLIDHAKANQVKVLMSVGGGRFNPYLDSLLRPDNRQAFVTKLVQLANDHHFDGIDADIENENLTANYEGFIVELSAALKKQQKLLTAALATWNAQLISDKALQKFDFINIMSYDQTGPWRPTEPGPHSTYEKAVADLQYWTRTRHILKKKISLGLPFYGYGFGTVYGESMSYGDILGLFPQAFQQDTIMPSGGGTVYYNGLSTIQIKTKLALQKAGGVMIWQLLQDAAGTASLLTNISDVIHKKPNWKN